MVACVQAYEALGYDCIALDFSGLPFKQVKTIEEAVALAQERVIAQLGDVPFADYGDVVFLSKSLGTILAGWYAQRCGLSPRHLLLTPVAQTMPFVTDDTRVIAMVIGTEDPVYDYRKVTEFCQKRRIPCLVIEDVPHNLKHENEAETEAINRRIVRLCVGA